MATHYKVTVSVLVAANNRTVAHAWGVAIQQHLGETFNDDNALSFPYAVVVQRALPPFSLGRVGRRVEE